MAQVNFSRRLYWVVNQAIAARNNSAVTMNDFLAGESYCRDPAGIICRYLA